MKFDYKEYYVYSIHYFIDFIFDKRKYTYEEVEQTINLFLHKKYSPLKMYTYKAPELKVRKDEFDKFQDIFVDFKSYRTGTEFNHIFFIIKLSN